jgi:hypothetical protein
MSAAARTVRSLVPARMDRLPWARFHWRVILGLGAAWILDGLEIQIVNTSGTVLTDKHTLGLSAAEVGLLASVYLLGEVVGAHLPPGKRHQRPGSDFLVHDHLPLHRRHRDRR